jgi:pilus assembly protein Flp/PilA
MDRINSVIVRLQNRRQEGQGMVEYALILAVVSVAAVAVLPTLGTGILNAFTTASGAF